MGKLKDLSGFEKIDLLRDMHRSMMTDKSWIVYETLYTNGLLPRLKYHDHHCMFHSFLKNPKRYRDQMHKVWTWMEECGYKPSLNLYKDMISACVAWRDLGLATKLKNEMLAKGMDVPEEAYHDLLQLHVLTPGLKTSIDGIAIWKEEIMANPNVIRSLSCFYRALELFGQTKDVAGIQETYKAAMLEYTESLDTTAKESPPVHSKLENARMSALVNSKAYAEVLGLYTEYRKAGGMLSPDSFSLGPASDTFNILFKMCYQSRDLALALQLWKDMRDLHLPVNIVTYGRLVSLMGMYGKSSQVESLFEAGVRDLALEPTSNRYRQFQTSLLEAYCHLENRIKAEALFKELSDHGKPLKFTVKMMAQLYEELGDDLARTSILQEHAIWHSSASVEAISSLN